MGTDICVEEVVRVFYSKTEKWKRDFFAPRKCDGVVFFTEGEIEYSFPDKKLTAKTGDLLFLPGNVPYSGKKLCETVAFYVIDFNCATIDEFEKTIHTTIVSTNDYNSMKAQFSEVLDMWRKQAIDRNLRVKSVVYSILCEAIRAEQKGTRVNQTDSIKDYICDNISMPSLSIKQLCEEFYISESQLRRNFLKQTGMTPHEYIIDVKLNLAKNELVHTSNSIKTISEKCGFNSPYYFSLFFSQRAGVSPSQYRKQTH